MSDGGDFNERLEVFFGETSAAVARVYARLSGVAPAAGLHLRGNLTGPSCAYAETLPARFSLADRGPGDSLLAEAVVTEPCFWTPEMPHVYRAVIELCRGVDVVERAERLVGIRPLGVAGRNLVYGGKRFVLRGARRRAVAAGPLADWHQASAAMVVDNPNDAVCDQASRLGVLLVAELDEPRWQVIQRLARWPAVGILSLPGAATVDLAGVAHNLILAARFAAHEPLLAPAWARAVICDLPRADLAAQLAGSRLPVLAVEGGGGMELPGVAEARARCDRMQRELAGRKDLADLDFAGFVV